MADNVEVAVHVLAADTDSYVRGMNAAAKAGDAVVKSAEGSVTVEDKRQKAIKATGSEMDRLEARFNKQIQLEQKLANVRAQLARIREQGGGSDEQASRIMSNAEFQIRRQIADLEKQDAAMRKSATATGLARYELINLSRQFQDIGVSLAGGQSPFRILIEQGSQIADIFASSRAKIGEIFSSMIGWAARAATSITGIAVVVGTLGAAAAALAITWLESQRSLERSLIGIGERAGVTSKEINEIAQSASKTTRLSTVGARGAAEEFIKTGVIYSGNIKQATLLTDKFALAMGVSAAEGAKQLAAILSDVEKGAVTLDQAFGFLDGKIKEQIRSAVAANDQQKAMKILMDAVTPSIEKAAAASSIWARAWMAVTSTMQNFVDRQGRNVMLVVGLWQSATAAVNETIAAMAEAFRRGQEFQLQREGGRARQGSPGRVAAQEMREPSAVAAPTRAAGTLKPVIDELALYKKAMDDAAASRDRLFGLEAEAAIKNLIPQIQQLQNLEKVLNDVKRAAESEGIRGGMASGMAAQLKAAADIGAVLKRTLEEAQGAAARAAAELLRLAAGGRQAANSVTVIKDAAQEGAVAVIRMGAAGRGISVEFQKISDSSQEAGVNVIKMGTGFKGVGLEAIRILTALDDQIKVANQLTGQAKIQAQEEARINQLRAEGKTLQEQILIATKETALKQAEIATAHQQTMQALEDQLGIAKATTESEKLRAQFQAEVNAGKAQGLDDMKAEEQAAMKIKIIEEQIAATKREANRRQAEADERRIDSAQRVQQIQGDFKGPSMGGPEPGGGVMGGFKGVPVISPGGMFISSTLQAANRLSGQIAALQSSLSGGNLPSVINLRGPEAVLAPLRDQLGQVLAQYSQQQASAAQAAADEQTQAAQQQIDAANAQKEAAAQQVEAAKAAREAQISSLDEMVKDIVATKLLAGQSAQAVNVLIEQGAIQFGTASTRFQTQLDLYKRAGASNAQIAADIRAGVIGEGARPSELLAALDSLTDAVDSNTAAQIGLSDFYTQQGDRLLGYRGYNVQTGIRSPIGATGGTGTIGTGGTGAIGGMGSVINPSGQVAAEFQGGGTGAIYPEGTVKVILVGSEYITYKLTNGLWVEISRAPRTGPTGYQRMQHGGIVDQPTVAMFGEAGPEAFVPLKGGAIPVKLIGAANNNQPTTVVNINAPLVNFMAEPTRDEVRESAFQASQMLRRVATGG